MKSDNEILESVKAFAAEAHGNQMRKFTNERYIEHLVRVQKIVHEYSDDLALSAAALLHDVLEDTEIEKEQLSAFLGDIMKAEQAVKTLELVEALTDVYTKPNYPALNRRVRRMREAERLGSVRAEAQTVKYADIIDNVSDIARQDTDFAFVYIREAKQMLLKMARGNPILRQRAVQTVNDALQAFWSQSNVRSL